MATDLFKVPPMKRPLDDKSSLDVWSPAKRRRIREHFLNFCDIVLAYTQYNSNRNQELRFGNNRSPLDSAGSTADSVNSDAPFQYDEDHFPSSRNTENMYTNNQSLADDSSFDEVTCFCGKPYMGRPMIECSTCYNWLHLSCVHLRKSNIPDTFICEACKRSPPQPQKSASAKRKLQHRKLQASHARHRASHYSMSADQRASLSPPSSSTSPLGDVARSAPTVVPVSPHSDSFTAAAASSNNDSNTAINNRSSPFNDTTMPGPPPNGMSPTYHASPVLQRASYDMSNNGDSCKQIESSWNNQPSFNYTPISK